MIKNDAWIAEMAQKGMIKPYEPSLIREMEYGHPEEEKFRKVISYGTSSYGYDIRLSPKDFRVFRHIPGTVVDPKNFNPQNLVPAELHSDENGSFFILPAHSYGLGVALEWISVPKNVTVICIGKSTYARVGVIANLTPAEAGFRGHLTLEFSNSSAADVRLYEGEGIVQLIFFQGEDCDTTYDDRCGKYQDQEHSVTLARV